MKQHSPTEWLALALLIDMAWVYFLLLLRKTKWFLAAWALGMLVAIAGVLFGGYMVLMLLRLSQQPGEVGLAGVGALMNFVLSLPFILLALLYVRVYRRYREGAPKNPAQ